MNQLKSHVVLSALIFVNLLLCPQVMRAQGLFGTISGIVADPTGGVISSAEVKVTNIETNVVRVVRTNSVGIYNATSLNPGTYRVEVDAPGFKKAVASGIVLEVNGSPRVNLTLQMGSTSETVSVTAEAAVLTTQQSNLSTTVTDKQFDGLPVTSSEGRNVYNFLSLVAGWSQQAGTFGYNTPRINGGRPRMDDYLIDGTTNEQPVFGGPSITPSVDSIQELHAETNNFSAEYGKVSGGVITIETKSGTGQFHGSLYEYFRSDSLDAKDYFAKTSLPLHFNEFGATFGGPILKNKLFFFSDYQGLRSSTTSPVVDQTVPNRAFRNGDLSALTTQLIDPQTQLPYQNNQVPVGLIAQKLLALYPLGNSGPSGQPGIDFWSGSSAVRASINRFNPRVDWNVTGKDHVFGVYHYQRERDTNEVVGFGIAPSYYSTNDVDTVTAGWTHTFGSTLLNDARFGWNHLHPVSGSTGYGQFGATDFGIEGLPACNLQGSSGKCGIPGINIGGYSSPNGGSIVIQPASTTQFSDILTKGVGKHTLKIGGLILRASTDNTQPGSPNGYFAFNGSGSGNPFSDFLIGYLAAGSQTQFQSQPVESRTWADALFIQDDWEVSRRLTLNLGLRWQYDPSWVSPLHQYATFDVSTLQWIQYGLNGVPEGLTNTDWKEFAPRVGFAWNPLQHFVIRGGFGITYPGVFSHGRAGDNAVTPNILTQTNFSQGTYLSSLPVINVPNPDAPLTLGEASFGTASTQRNQGATYTEQWNLTVEKEIARNTVARVAYVGTHGVHLPINFGYNVCQQSRENVAEFGAAAATMDSPYCAPGNFTALGGKYGDYVFPGYDTISSSSYNALQITLDRRFSAGLSVLSTFTWSKLLDDSSSDWPIGAPQLDSWGQDLYDRGSDRSVSAGDIPARWSTAAIYELPFGPGKPYLQSGIPSQVLGGWRAGTIYSLSSGEPIPVSDGGFLFCSAARTLAVRPTLIGDPRPSGFHKSINEWFNTDAFDWSGTCVFTSNVVQLHGQGNPAYAFGNAPRFLSNVRAPSVNEVDFSLQKDFQLPFREGARLRFQGDAFNMLNHPQFAAPTYFPTINFGKITGTRFGQGRILQVGLHVLF